MGLLGGGLLLFVGDLCTAGDLTVSLLAPFPVRLRGRGQLNHDMAKTTRVGLVAG